MTLATVVYQISHHVCLPLMLIMNFSVFQYLTGTYWKRRHEPRVKLLMGSGLASFASLIIFSYPDTELVHNMHDMSEVATILTFLIQITIIGRDVNRKVRVRSLQLATYAAEFLILIGYGTIAANIVDNAFPHEDHTAMIVFDHIIEDISLIFVFVFRFYFMCKFKGGWRNVLAKHKGEVITYVSLMLLPVPFSILDHARPDADWAFIRGFFMRIFVVVALGITLRNKIRKSSQTRGANSSVAQTGAGTSSVGDTLKTIAKVSKPGPMLPIGSKKRAPQGTVVPMQPIGPTL